MCCGWFVALKKQFSTYDHKFTAANLRIYSVSATEFCTNKFDSKRTARKHSALSSQFGLSVSDVYEFCSDSDCFICRHKDSAVYGQITNLDVFVKNESIVSMNVYILSCSWLPWGTRSVIWSPRSEINYFRIISSFAKIIETITAWLSPPIFVNAPVPDYAV